MAIKENVIIIKPSTRPLDINWREIWDSRDLFYYLTWRDIKVRYKQTVLGVAWIILQPLVSMVVFTIIFGNFAAIPSDNIPYPIFVFIGLLFWNFFSSALSSASNSLISNENILKKVYFPRLMVPVSSTFAHIVDLLPTLVILIGLLFYYRVSPTLEIILLMPFLFLMMLVSALGLGMFLAPINAKYRDVRYILPFFIQLLMFVTPVIWPTSLFGGTSQMIRIFNPVAEAIDVSRSAFFGTRPMDWPVLGVSSLFSAALFLLGFYYFRKKEDSFIDIL